MPIFVLELQIGHFLWLVFSLLLGAAYATLLYPKGRRSTGTPAYVFFGMRTLCIAAICFLLFAPQISSRRKIVEKPLIIFAQDNSASITLGSVNLAAKEGYRAALRDLLNKLSKRYTVDTLLLGDSVRPGFHSDLQDKSTNLSSLFQYIRDLYGGRNVGAVILASDGLYNRGGDPSSTALSLRAPIYSIAFGDTNVRRDLRISNVNYNELVQAGNKFEIGLQIEAHRSKDQRARLSIYRSKNLIFSKDLNFDSEDFRLTLPVVLPAQQAGTARYSVRLDTLADEISVSNNTSDFYVRAHDNRKKILIIADAPHPDIGAIKRALDSDGNYQLTLSYSGELKPASVQDADLLILYQLPSHQQSMKAIASIIKKKPLIYILGAKSDVLAFSSMQGMLDLKPASSLTEVSASVNAAFPAFSIPDSLASEVRKYGPLLVPFSDVRFKSGHYDLLYQNAGKFETSRPLFSLASDVKPRFAVIGGEGIWRWRLEASNTGADINLVDDLLRKTVQYLVADTEGRRFRVYATKDLYTDNESITLNAELYNESLELINKPDVALNLRGRAGQVYSFQFSRVNSSYVLNLGTLPAGEYTYEASTRLGKQAYTAEGAILVSSDQLEFQEVKANHQQLYQLARQSGGSVIFPERLAEMDMEIDRNENVKTVFYEDAAMSDLIGRRWLLGLICALLFSEWYLRKRGGEL